MGNDQIRRRLKAELEVIIPDYAAEPYKRVRDTEDHGSVAKPTQILLPQRVSDMGSD
jgi:hypothetical protein